MPKASKEQKQTSIKSVSDKSIIALVIFLFVFTVGLVAFIFIKNANVTKSISSKNRTEYRNVVSSAPVEEYTQVEETASTPVEVNNSTLNELDSLMKDIDSTSNEDINDLSL